MSQMQTTFATSGRTGAGEMRALNIVRLGLSLSTFFAISYAICIAGYLLFPGFPVQHAALSIFLPGFELLSWRSFTLGLVESFIWGWYIAVVFAPLYNFFGRRVAH
jgi:hypothetical protein